MSQVAFGSCGASGAMSEFFCPLPQRMLSLVFFRGNNHEIFKSIICSISVDVMNLFAFFCVCAYSVFVFPFVWLFCFYHDIHKSFGRLVQCLGSNWDLLADFIQNSLSSGNNVRSKRLPCTIKASRRVMICVAVSPFFTHDWCATKRTRFGKKFFHTDTVYQE